MYHTLASSEVINDLTSDSKKGLTPAEVTARQAAYGLNVLPEHKKETWFKKLSRQFTSILVVLLLVAAGVSFFLGERLDALAIMVIVLINGFMGYIQEAKAEKAIEALKKLATETTRVLRAGEFLELSPVELVPGDIIFVESGTKVPADCRIIDCVSLEVNEAVLTGESKTVKKVADVLVNPTAPLGDRINLLFKNTSVVFGKAKAVVIYTGKATEIGKISELLQREQKEETPLTKELDIVGKRLSYSALVIITLIFIVGVFVRHLSFEETLLTSISLAVAAIPEGLPAVITISLALGMARLAKQKAIIRRLGAVETLGSVNYILTDKTGTLTQNKMTVTDIFCGEQYYSVIPGTPQNYENLIVDQNDKPIEPKLDSNLTWLIACAVLCNDAEPSSRNETQARFLGDSTETALLELAETSGYSISELRAQYPRVFEIPFSSETKKMLVVVRDLKAESKYYVICKGASEVVQWLVTKDNSEVEAINRRFAQQGLRSLAVSSKELTKAEVDLAKAAPNPEDILSVYHTYCGTIAQKDPLRPNVKAALLEAARAGIKTIMLTGDHKLTASSIAKELELIKDDSEAMDGPELGDIKGKKLQDLLQHIKVFARVSPEQKLTITKEIKEMGYITAVTGDGVNDAPAIKSGNIGISMGISGTDVAKEVSDMVLQDDNYATIVAAISQGRIIYTNFVKFISYLISCNISEILVITFAILKNLPLPIVPIQILWVNLTTDGFPALALGVEPGESDIMDRPPRKQGNLLTMRRWLVILEQAFFMTVGTLVAYNYVLATHTVVQAQSVAFTTLVFSQLFNTLNSKSEKHSLLSPKVPYSNVLTITILVTAGLHFMTLYSTFGNTYLKTTPLDINLILISLGSASFVLVGAELAKLLRRIKKVALA